MARRADSSRVAFWRELIERRRRGGLSVARVCQQAGVSPASFYQWQRKLRGVAAPVRKTASEQSPASRLVPVRIVPDTVASRDSSGVLEIELPGEIRLRIPASYDAASLKLVLSMLLDGGGREAGSC